MRIFVTGASGWIGSAVVPELVSAGHQVLGLARSDASARTVAGMGADVLRGDLTDTDILRAGALDSDGVIHLAFIPGRPGFEAAVQADAAAIETFAANLAGSGKPMLISGATIVTPGRPATERDELIAQGPVAARITNMQAALAAAERDVRACLVMLPRSVHGQGERHGFVPQLIAMARAKGVSGYIGDGASRWPAVHVKDAARLYRLAAEQAPAGAVLNAVGDEGEVDDAVDVEGAGAQRVGVVQVAAQDIGAHVGDCFGGGVRAGQPENLVAGTDEFGDDGRADPAGCACDEDMHE